MIQPVRGNNPRIGYFLRGAKVFAQSRTLDAIGRFIMGIIFAAYDRTVAGIQRALGDAPSPAAMRLFLNSKTLTGRLAQIVDWKTSQSIRKALLCNANRLGTIVLAVDSTFKGTLSRYAKHLCWPGHGGRVGNHVFVFGVLIFPDGRCLPVRPRQKKKKGRGAVSQVDLAVELVQALAADLAGRDVVVTADSFFFAKKVLKAVRRCGFHYVIACQGNTVLASGPNLQSRVDTLHLRGSSVVLPGYRGERKKNFSAALKHLLLRTGGMQAVVFSRRHKKRRAQLKYLASDLLDATATQICQWYALRWQVELFFRETKMYLGLDQYRVSGEHGSENFAMLVTLAYQFLHWYGRKAGRRCTTLTRIRQLARNLDSDNVAVIERAAITRHKRKKIKERYGQMKETCAQTSHKRAMASAACRAA